jgi:hypothetical protein
MTVITLDLNRNYAEALLHHARTFKPASNDPREDMRLADALEDLVAAIEQHFAEQPASPDR